MPSPASTRHRIRPATGADLDRLLALENLTFTTDLLSRRRLRHWISASNGILLVAVNAAGLAGYCLALTRKGSREARLYSLAIAHSARGQGLGGRLLQATERACRRLGCTSLRLEVAPDNHGALALYQKHGYVRFGRIPAFYEDGKDALRLRKVL